MSKAGADGIAAPSIAAAERALRKINSYTVPRGASYVDGTVKVWGIRDRAVVTYSRAANVKAETARCTTMIKR